MAVPLIRQHHSVCRDSHLDVIAASPRLELGNSGNTQIDSIHRCVINLLCWSYNTAFTNFEAVKCVVLRSVINTFLLELTLSLECAVIIK